MKRSYHLFIALTLITFISCTKKGDTGPAGPAGPSFKGCISGYVSIYDAAGSKKLTGLQNIVLTLKGGTTINADVNGHYIFTNVSSGTYNITASGPGMAATLVNNIGFVSDTFFKNITLSAVPDFNISSFKAFHNAGSQFDSLIMTVPTDTRSRNVIVFVNNSPVVNNMPGNYLGVFTKAVNASPWPGTATLPLRISASDLNNLNLYYGDKVYYAAYSYVVNDASVYDDPQTGAKVYNAVGTGLVDSTTAP